MEAIEQLMECTSVAEELVQGDSARIKYTGQIVELKSVSAHGISIVVFRTGGEHFISNKFLEPVRTLH